VHGFTNKKLLHLEDFPMEVRATVTGQPHSRRSIIVTQPEISEINIQREMPLEEDEIKYENNTLFRRGVTVVNYAVPEDEREKWSTVLAKEATRLGAERDLHPKSISLTFPAASKTQTELMGELLNVISIMSSKIREILNEPLPIDQQKLDSLSEKINGYEGTADQLYLRLKRNSTLICQHAPYLTALKIDDFSELPGQTLISEYLQEITNMQAGCLSIISDMNSYVKDLLGDSWKPHRLDWMVTFYDKCDGVHSIIKRELDKCIKGETPSKYELMNILKNRTKARKNHRTFEYISGLVEANDRELVFSKIEEYSRKYGQAAPNIGIYLHGIEERIWRVVAYSRRIGFELRNLVIDGDSKSKISSSSSVTS
jgi:hypothetical protein